MSDWMCFLKCGATCWTKVRSAAWQSCCLFPASHTCCLSVQGLQPWTDAFIGLSSHIQRDKAALIQRPLQNAPAFTSWIWRLHQMDTSWPCVTKRPSSYSNSVTMITQFVVIISALYYFATVQSTYGIFVPFVASVYCCSGTVYRRFVFRQVRDWRPGSACRRGELEPRPACIYVHMHVSLAFSVCGDMCRMIVVQQCGALVK